MVTTGRSNTTLVHDAGTDDSQFSAQRRGRIPALDGLRGVAVFVVVMLHLGMLRPTWPLSFLYEGGAFRGGFLGVDVFFVLSGFLITDLLLREQQQTGKINFALFWRARAFRLLPPLAFFLIAVIVYNVATGYPVTGTPEAMVTSVVAVLMFMTNWAALADGPFFLEELGHLWSLSIEEQFYVLWPFAVLLVIPLRRRPAFVSSALISVMIAVGVWRAVRFESDGWLTPYLRTDTRVDALLVGALVASLHARGRRVDRFPVLIRGAPVVAVALLIAALFGPNATSFWYYRGGFTLVAVGTALMVAVLISEGVQQRRPWLVRCLEWRPLRALGIVSYGLYLWHLAVFVAVRRLGAEWNGLVRAIVGLAVTAAAVTASWYLVEAPVQRMRRRLDSREADRRSAPGAVSLNRPSRWSPMALTGLAVGASMLAVAGLSGRLMPASGHIGQSQRFFDLRANSFLNLADVPPRGTLLAEMVASGSETATFHTANILPSIVRIPFIVLNGSHPTNASALSMAAAWLLAAISIGSVTRTVARRLETQGRLPSVLGAGAAIGLACAIVAISPSARAESWAWIVAPVVFAVAAALAFAERASAGRGFTLVGAGVLAALTHPVVGGLVAGAVAIACVVGLTNRDNPSPRRSRFTVVGVLSVTLGALLAATLGPLDRGPVQLSQPDVAIGWNLPKVAPADAIFVRGSCTELFAAGPDASAPWDSAYYEWLKLAVFVPGFSTADAPVAIASLAGEVPVVVSLSGDGHGRMRFEVSEGSDLIASGRWETSLGGLRMPLTVRRDGANIVVVGNGEELARLAVVEAESGIVRAPRVILNDFAAELGATVQIDEPEPRSESCGSVIDAAVRSAAIVRGLPASAGFGDMAIVGACDALYVASDRAKGVWDLFEIKPLVLDITYPRRPMSAARRELARSTAPTPTVVSVESDGDGRVRYSFSVDFVGASSEWLDVAADATHRIRLDFNGPAGLFVLAVDGVTIGWIPALTGSGADETMMRFAPVEPQADSELEATVKILSQLPTPTCVNAIDEMAPMAVAGWTDVPVEASSERLLVVGDCAGVVATDSILSDDGTVQRSNVLGIADVTFEVMARPEMPERGAQSSQRIEVVRFDDEPLTHILVEVDGAMRMRIVGAVPFLEDVSDWFDLSSGPVTVRLHADLDQRVWRVIVNSALVATLPLTDDPERLAAEPTAAPVELGDIGMPRPIEQSPTAPVIVTAITPDETTLSAWCELLVR
ncbi:acyltransferase family protein [Ilumatobacter sp.]|uniref:acyltransferase family protein n=1 Tax=Ilumatobacter sp. TaxID=1967498 RepID=UPI00375267D9